MPRVTKTALLAAKIQHLLQSVLEEVSDKAGLSKRQAVLLLILHDAKDYRLLTEQLGEEFRRWNVSSSQTAAKDVSLAKAALFRKDLIVARGGTKNVELNESGILAAERLAEAVDEKLSGMTLGPDSPNLLTLFNGLQVPNKPPEKAGVVAKGKRSKKSS